MSDAIVAKALNDTLGTPEFEGLNSILDRQLTELSTTFSDTFDKFIEDLRDLNKRQLVPSDKYYWTLNVNGEKRDIQFVADGAIKIRFEAKPKGNVTVSAEISINESTVKRLYITGEAGTDNSLVEKTEETVLFVREGDVVSANTELRDFDGKLYDGAVSILASEVESSCAKAVEE